MIPFEAAEVEVDEVVVFEFDGSAFEFAPAVVDKPLVFQRNSPAYCFAEQETDCSDQLESIIPGPELPNAIASSGHLHFHCRPCFQPEPLFPPSFSCV